MHWYVNYPESETFFTPVYNVDFSYPAHLHGCLEVSYCVSGCVTIVLDEQTYTLNPGEGILIPPNMVHSYHTPQTSAYYTILFSRDLLPDFAAKFSRKQPSRYVFTFDAWLDRHIREFYNSKRTIFGVKSLLYHTAEVFLQDNPFINAEWAGDNLTMQIISYLQDNLHNEVSLHHMADHLGYSYFYISKRIQQIFHVSFSTLLSQYRVAYAKNLLNTGKYTISQAALASGFGSIRTFNRVFFNLTGQTPSQFLSMPSRAEVLNQASDDKI